MTNDDAECAMLYRWLRDQKSLSLTTDGSTWTDREGKKFVSTHSLSANGIQFSPAISLDENIKAAMASIVSRQ